MQLNDHIAAHHVVLFTDRHKEAVQGVPGGQGEAGPTQQRGDGGGRHSSKAQVRAFEHRR